MKIYLAIPYSGIEEMSFKVANLVTAELMLKGHIVFSPISQNHPVALEAQLPTGWDFWKDFDTSFIEWCDEVYVVEIHEFKGKSIDYKGLLNTSKGVKAELEIAKSFGKPNKTVIFKN